jgi:hypothetical protein
MKKFILTILAIVSLVSVLLWYAQSRQTAEEQAKLAAARQQLAEAEDRAAEHEKLSLSRQEQLQEARAELVEKESKVVQLQRRAAATHPAPSRAPDKPSMSSLFNDPQMRSVLKKQATEAMEKRVNQLVNRDLIGQLNLNEEQAAALKALLVRKDSAGMEFMMSMMTGELDEAGTADQGKWVKDGIAAADAEIKAFLGEEAYKTFELQEKSQPDRERVDKFRSLCDKSQMPLLPEQQDQLLAAMFEERMRFPFQINFEDPASFDFEHFHAFFSEEHFNTHFQEVEQVNEKIAARAQAILTPGQLAQFKTMQQDHLAQSRFTVKTTQALLGQNGKGPR